MIAIDTVEQFKADAESYVQPTFSDESLDSLTLRLIKAQTEESYDIKCDVRVASKPSVSIKVAAPDFATADYLGDIYQHAFRYTNALLHEIYRLKKEVADLKRRSVDE